MPLFVLRNFFATGRTVQCRDVAIQSIIISPSTAAALQRRRAYVSLRFCKVTFDFVSSFFQVRIYKDAKVMKMMNKKKEDNSFVCQKFPPMTFIVLWRFRQSRLGSGKKIKIQIYLCPRCKKKKWDFIRDWVYFGKWLYRVTFWAKVEIEFLRNVIWILFICLPMLVCSGWIEVSKFKISRTRR